MQYFITDKLALGFWGYRPFEGQDIAGSVRLWKEAGFNIGLSFIYGKDDDCPEKMLALLDCCEESGIRLILYDDRIHCHRLQEMSEAAYEQAVLRSVKEFGSHPAAAAFFVSDEPDRNTLPLAVKAVRIVQKHSPVPAFVNFYPVWHTPDYKDLLGMEGSGIGGLYQDVVRESGLKCLSYDCYGAMNIREPETEVYFDNLNTWQRIAREAGVPLWTSLLCTGHWAFRQPSLTDLRWQLSTALAHGVKGVQWFMLYDNDDHMGDSPIDRYNERQPSYFDLRKVNREFSEDLGRLIPLLELERVCHYGTPWGGTPAYRDGEDPFLERFWAKYQDDAVISRFRHRESGRLWYMFVNGSRTAGNQFHCRFGSPYEHLSKSVWLDAGRYALVELRERD